LTGSNLRALHRLNFTGGAAQILEDVSNYHRLGILWENRYWKAATQHRDFSDERRNVQSGQCNHRRT